MALNNFASPVRSAIVDALVDRIDLGSTDATGDLQIATAAYTSVLATPTWANPAFGDGAAGVATANAITSDTNAANSGTAAVLRIRDRDNGTVVDGTVGTSGEDLNLNTTTITAGDTVAITAATMTAPAS